MCILPSVLCHMNMCLFSVIKTTQILSRQSQSTHKKCRSSYCMIKIKTDSKLFLLQCKDQRNQWVKKLPAIERQQDSSSIFSSSYSFYANHPEGVSLSTSS